MDYSRPAAKSSTVSVLPELFKLDAGVCNITHNQDRHGWDTAGIAALKARNVARYDLRGTFSIDCCVFTDLDIVLLLCHAKHAANLLPALSLGQ